MGGDSGIVHLPELQQRMEKALVPFNFAKPAIASVNGSDVYFASGVYEKWKSDPAATKALMDAMLAQPGVVEVYRAEDLRDRPATKSGLRDAFADGYYPERSGDLLIAPKAYWLLDSTASGKARTYGTGHGTPWNYDQHVPVLFMGYGIQAGEYYEHVTPADIAPTLAAICGITLAPRDGRVLGVAISKTKRSKDNEQ
jgi:hypothetical protein